MGESRSPGHRDGAAAVHLGWDGLLLAGMGLSVHLHRHLDRRLALSHEARPGASRTPDAGWPDRGAAAGTEAHHVAHIDRLHRAPRHTGARCPLWVVWSAA